MGFQGLLFHVSIATLLVVLTVMVLLPVNALEEQRRKLFCCGNRCLLATGLIFGNLLGVFPTLYTVHIASSNVPTEFLKNLGIVTLLASTTFSLGLAAFYRNYTTDEKEEENISKTTPGKILDV